MRGITHLDRCFRSAQATTVEPRPIEAANASLPRCEHRARVLDPPRASLLLLGRGDPLDPISARDRRDLRPQGARSRGGRRECLPQICRHPRFRFLFCRSDLKRNHIAWLSSRCFTHLTVYLQPVAFLAVWLERRSKGMAINGAFDRRHAPRR